MSKLTSLSRPDRREVLIGMGAAGLVLATATLVPSGARADAAAVDAEIKKLAGDKAIKEGRITLEVPQIAENGNTVPISVSVDSPMTDQNYVKSVHLYAPGNPAPNVATFRFTPASGKALASTRMRLAKTQKVVAVAEMSDGSMYRTSAEIKVTIGGCGG
jgi:sulfur-oxidizing protein SoxY